MNEINYLTCTAGGCVQLSGFHAVEDFMLISLVKGGTSLVIETLPLNERENRFMVSVSKDRLVTDIRLFRLVKEFGLENKRFIYNEPRGNYFPSQISI